MRFLLTFLAALLCISGTPVPARGGATTPALALSTAVGLAGGGGRVAVFQGSFDFPNALQLGYPIDLVVFQGTRFVRYPFADAAVTGASPELADGVLVSTEVPALVSEGAAVAPGVQVVTLTGDSIRVALPATFDAGPVRAVVFAILTDGTALSNTIDFVLP
jgi:hypothetical protein